MTTGGRTKAEALRTIAARTILAVVCAFQGAALVELVDPAPVAAVSVAVPRVTFTWPTEVGTVGNAIVVRHASGEGNLRVALRMKPSSTSRVSIYAGACGALGRRIAGPFPVTISPDGLAKQSMYLRPSVISQISAGKSRFSVVVGSTRQCGTLPRKPFSCRATSTMTPWRILVLVSPSVQLSYRAPDGSSVAFASAFTPEEIDAIRRAALGLPDLVASWSGGTAAVTVAVDVLASPLRSLSYEQGQILAPDYRDIWSDFRSRAPFGAYDLVVHAWKASNDSGGAVPAYTWLWGKPSIWTQGAMLASVALGEGTTVDAESIAFIWLTEVALYYGTFGYRPIPDPGALGNGAYAPDASGSLALFYADFMTGRVHDPAGAPLGGITAAMWRSGRPSTRPYSCVAVC